MLLSRSNRFVFIKTRKTASTSLEIFFSRFCEDGDIITPIIPRDEVLRLDHGGHLPRNYSASRAREANYRKAIESRDLESIRTSVRGRDLIFRNHMSLAEVRKKVRVPKDFIVISSERHPYEKVVSMTYFFLRNRNLAEVDFSAEVDAIIETRKYRNFDAYQDPKGKLEVRVLRYENLQSDLENVCRDMNLSYSEGCLPVAKADFRKSRADAISLLSESQKERIAEICRDEFEFHGYEY